MSDEEIKGVWYKAYIISAQGVPVNEAAYAEVMGKFGRGVTYEKKRTVYSLRHMVSGEKVAIDAAVYEFFKQHGAPRGIVLEKSKSARLYTDTYVTYVTVDDVVLGNVSYYYGKIKIESERYEDLSVEEEPAWTTYDEAVGKFMGAIKEVLDKKFHKHPENYDEVRLVCRCNEYYEPNTVRKTCPIPEPQ